MYLALIKTIIVTLVVSQGLFAQGSTKLLMGKWQTRTEDGIVTLQFVSEKQLIYDGETMSCVLKPKVISVEDEGLGWVDYPYTLKAGVLTITYPEGYQLQFTKVKTAVKTRSRGTGASKLVAHFAGTWKNYTKNTETLVVLEPNGDYYERYTSSYSGGGYAPDGEWGTATDTQHRGRWSLKGTMQQGVITITNPDGSQTRSSTRFMSKVVKPTGANTISAAICTEKNKNRIG